MLFLERNTAVEIVEFSSHDDMMDYMEKLQEESVEATKRLTPDQLEVDRGSYYIWASEDNFGFGYFLTKEDMIRNSLVYKDKDPESVEYELASMDGTVAHQDHTGHLAACYVDNDGMDPVRSMHRSYVMKKSNPSSFLMFALAEIPDEFQREIKFLPKTMTTDFIDLLEYSQEAILTGVQLAAARTGSDYDHVSPELLDSVKEKLEARSRQLDKNFKASD